MLYAVRSFITEYSLPPGELALMLEQRGFKSLWVPEHTHIPSSRRSPWPGGDELPRDYWHAYDPFIALTAAAAATTTLKLGTGVCLVIEHDPSWPIQSRPWTGSPADASSSASAAAGTLRRWRTTAPISRHAGACCGSASWR